jgi:hypothetical protein
MTRLSRNTALSEKLKVTLEVKSRYAAYRFAGGRK